MMNYTTKFQALADAARSRVSATSPTAVDDLARQGAILLDIRDSEEHAVGCIAGSLNLSRGKLEMKVESLIPDLDTVILCYCNANNRGALCADALVQMGYRNASFIEGGLNAYRALAG
jgi:phage shock protein E